jgi:CubicO group peptidase (beta-lactamase class C family)
VTGARAVPRSPLGSCLSRRMACLLLLLFSVGCTGAGGATEESPVSVAGEGAASGVALTGGLASAPVSVPAGDLVHGELGRDLDQMLAGLSENGFAGAVLVAENGIIYLKKGYGLADRSLELANDSETLFDVGSLARILTATAILNLE